MAWYQDDIALGGVDRADHLQRLRAVLTRLREIGLKTQPSKLKLSQSEINFLGYRLNGQGIQPRAEKVEAIKNMQAPQNTTELRSFLGTINYYVRFIPNLQSQCGRLHQLLQKHTKWNWSEREEETFKSLKEQLSANSIIVHFQPSLPLVLSVDSSTRGIGRYYNINMKMGHFHLLQQLRGH